jgi:hypothetical protein
LKQLLATAMVELREGLVTLDPGTARALAHLAGTFVKTIESAEFESRLLALEVRNGLRPANGEGVVQ